MDKENRILLEICPHIDLPRISTGSGAPSEEDPQLEEIQLLGYDLFYGCDSKDWPVISDNTLTERRRRNLSDRYLFLISIGIGTKPVKVNFWTRLFSGFSGVTSAVYRLPFESTDKWCSVPNCPFPEPHDPNPSRNWSVLRLKTMICAWLRFATYR